VTINIDQYSDFSHTFLQEDTLSKETLKGKLAFKRYPRKVGVNIEHYHLDNGRFADNAFISYIKD